MTGLQLKLDNFEGPYDLLLDLLERKKMEITEVSISQIADTYLDVIFSDGFDIEIGSEFLVVASTLIKMKSAKLLPKPEVESEDELTEEELARRLIIYKQFKELAAGIVKLQEDWQGALYRMPEKLEFERKAAVTKIDPERLSSEYALIKKLSEERFTDNTAKMGRILKVQKVSLKEKIRHVFNFIKEKFKAKFSDIFPSGETTKAEKITGFIAVLELAKRSQIKVKQKKLFGDINITKKGDMTNPDFTVSEDYNEWK